ncbi:MULTISPECIES: hypothetical protein [Bacillus]|uniref:DUF4871 domain-containing protein n=2 Tax=Bacillus infantis TaxID=324767 RepID=U5LB75_9BACI|nr:MULTISPECIES: hypothetical protein [Bacillus]AGX03976.1 hypothetical protein N288_10305 [Bacillus infantis NRRL B-14911]MCK6206308.1 hypothetical protein [Bacillus infantis]OXT18554.1 hypothetical protein B9K06_04755 [Bacillus sp. OG2]
MKKILAYVLFTLLISSGCSNENEIKELPAVSHNSIEELKTWSPTARTAIELEGKSLNLYGEIGKYALSPDVIRVDTQGKHTWYLWMKPEEKKELLHEKVTIKGISEKDKNEEIYLADTKLVDLSSDEKQSMPYSENALKFIANITPVREGRWKINTYVDNSLLGTTVIEAQPK